MKKVFRKCYKCGATNETPGTRWHARILPGSKHSVWICHFCEIKALEERRGIKLERRE